MGRKLIGCIDTVVNGKVSGWVANADKTTHEEKITIEVDGKSVADGFARNYRNDLEKAGIAGGYAGFEVDISKVLSNKENIKIKVISKNVLIAEKNLKVVNNRPLNSKPILRADSFRTLSGIELDLHSRDCVYFENIPSISFHKEPIFGGSFLRIFQLNNENEGRPIVIPQLTEDLSRFRGKVLQIGLIARSQWYVDFNVYLLDKNGRIFASDNVKLNQEFKSYVIPVYITNKDKYDLSVCTLSIELRSTGRNFVDISAITLSDNGSDFSFLISCDKSNLLVAKDKGRNLIANGNLEKWSNGIVFKNPARGKQLADNWYLEYARQNDGCVQAQLVTLREGNDPLANETLYGLRVNTTSLNGYCRLVVPVDLMSLKKNEYEFEIRAKSFGLKPESEISRVSLLLRSEKEDKFIHDFVRGLTLSERETHYRSKLDYYQIERIHEASICYGNMMLVIDVPEHSDIVINKLKFIERDYAESAFPESLNDSEKNIFIEDGNIAAQINNVAGISDWGKSEIITSCLPEEKKSIPDFFEVASIIENKFPEVDIVIPVYNAKQDVINCVLSILRNTTSPYRLIIIDDCSDTPTKNALIDISREIKSISIIRNEENLGYTKSVNKGLRATRSDWVIILNSDTIVTPGWLEGLHECAQSSDSIGMVGALSNAASWQSVPYVQTATGEWHLNPIPNHLSIDDMAARVRKVSLREFPKVKVINGFCQFIRSSMLEKIGLLDEEAFPYGYGEENDMCARAIKAGYSLAIADHVYIYHAKSKSFGHSRRKILSKEGAKSLAQKHADVDWTELASSVRDSSVLADLRRRLLAALID